MDMKKLFEKHPLIEDIANCKEIFWVNPDAKGQVSNRKGDVKAQNLGVDIDGAEARLLRFAPFIAKMFPDAKDGIIESELREISSMKALLEKGKEGKEEAVDVKGRLFLKCDSHLPVSGSIKARGGIYEVLKLAEKIDELVATAIETTETIVVE